MNRQSPSQSDGRPGHMNFSEVSLEQWRDSNLIKHTKSAEQLVNIERAYDIMDRHGLGGLVATSATNIHYLSSHSGVTQWMGRPFTTFAFLPRAEDAPAALIMPRFTLYHLDFQPTWMPSVHGYSRPILDESGAPIRNDDGSLAADQNPNIWPVREGDFNHRDRTLLALFAEYEGKLSATPIYALRQALIEGGVRSGKLGVEDTRVGAWLQDAGLPDLQPVDATNILKEIRMVKTQPEIDLLRIAAQKNETALDYAIEQIEPGFPLIEIEKAHARKWGELDGVGKWCVANIHGLNSGVVAAGDFMKLDSVGTYCGYHGDVGRTVVVGEPTDELARRIEADTKCSRMVYDAIRPGMLFTEATTMFADLMKQEGFTAVSSPHCVGLNHTDQPFYSVEPFQQALGRDWKFEAGTVFTLDMPHNEIGWGTTHVEDMILVKKSGYEGLSSMDTSLRIRPV